METWEKFEIDSTKFLNDNFIALAKFTRQGGSDSTIPDILVETKTHGTYYIEAKHCPAQCGQFVLLPNLNSLKFDYSSKNINKINPYAERIMEEMNKSFDEYKEAGTAGKDISFKDDQIVFSNWITSIYKGKNVKFIITNNFKILPIDDFTKAFKITAKYRIKRSGSSSVGSSRISLVKSHLQKYFSISSTKSVDDKLFITSSTNLHNQRFIISGTEYMISKRDSEYEIRKLSNTFNANVIFSIELKQGYEFLSDSQFITLI